MKSFTLLILLVGIHFLSPQEGNSLVLVNRNLFKYPVESGKIVYEVSGNAKGTSTLYFDRFGWRWLLISDITMMQFGIESKEVTREGADGDYAFKINMTSLKGTQKKDDRWSQLIKYKDPLEIVNILNSAEGGVINGQEVLAGKETNHWIFSKGIVKGVNEWKGIILKTEKKLPGLTYEITAISFQDSIKIDESIFSIPEGVSWE